MKCWVYQNLNFFCCRKLLNLVEQTQAFWQICVFFFLLFVWFFFWVTFLRLFRNCPQITRNLQITIWKRLFLKGYICAFCVHWHRVGWVVSISDVCLCRFLGWDSGFVLRSLVLFYSYSVVKVLELLLILGKLFPEVSSYKPLLPKPTSCSWKCPKEEWDVFQGNAINKWDEIDKDPGCCFFLLTVSLR